MWYVGGIHLLNERIHKHAQMASSLFIEISRITSITYDNEIAPVVNVVMMI